MGFLEEGVTELRSEGSKKEVMKCGAWSGAGAGGQGAAGRLGRAGKCLWQMARLVRAGHGAVKMPC